MVIPNSKLSMKSTIKFLLFTVIVLVFTSYAFSQVPNYVPTNGLVGYWPFNGNANDESGNGNNGTVNGATLTSDRFGNVNSAYDFNGTSDFIDVADNTALRLNSTDFTISVWINETSRASTQESIISKRTAANGNGYILNIEGSVQPIPGLTNFHVSGGGDPRAYSNTIVPLNVWKNITLTYQLSSQTLKTYIDGVLNSTTTSIPTPNAANSVAMKIGTDAAGNPYFFHGKIDDISIYNRALTQQEISTIPVSCLPAYVPTSGLVGYWPFCGNANDESGNGNNGTVNGATLTSDRFGNVNSAYDFNGTSDFIDVADNTALRLNSTDFTISVWINETSRASTQESIISKRTAANGNGYILNIEGSVQPIPGLTNFHVSGGGDPRAYSNTIVPLNVWKNITLTYQLSSQTLKTYIDGVLNSTTTSIPTPNAANSVAMKIGTDAAGNPYFFHGKIDDISIYNRALTQQEITNLYTSTVPVSCLPAYVPTSGLVGYWPFCGNANDESGNGNNGTNNGATLSTDRNGLTNSSYSFSSDNQNITINGLYQNGISEYSVSGWFYKLSSTINQEGTLVSGATCDPSPIRTGLRVFAGLDDHLYYSAESQNCVNGVGTGTTSYFISDGIWHHFTAIFNSPIGNIQPTAFNIFIDGQLVNQNQYAQQINNLPTAPINNQGLSLIFGNSNCSCDYFPGKLDDIGIWNRALTPQEITNLYTSTVPPTAAVLSGDATICAGASTNLSVAVTGGTTPYTVTVTDGTNNYSATGASPVSIPVSPTATSSYTIVSVTGGGTGTGNIGTATVTVIDATITASDSVICAGETVTLSVPQGGSSNTACAALPTNLQTGLVGYWPFCGNANDASGNGNNGTVNGATLTTDRFGSANSAYSFDGVNQYIATQSAQNQIQEKTFCAWVKLSNVNQSGGGIVSIQTPSGSMFDAMVYNELNNGWFFGSDNFSRSSTSNYMESDTQQWVHMVFTYQSGNFKMYRNGILIYTDNQFQSYQFNSDAIFIIGLRHYGSNGYFNGKIDDVAIWNRALTATEIQQIYNLGQTTYLWSTSATTPTINVSPITTTTYTCTVTTNGVSCTDSVTVVVNNPTIDLGNDVTACGTSTTLTAPTGYDSYLWSNGATTNTTTVSANGSYSCTVTQGGCSASDSIDVTLIDVTISASDSVICAGDSVTLSVPQGGFSNTACAALPTNLQSGLVGYWPFCGNANDASGNGNNGTVNGATLTTDRFGSANSAYSFDGVDDWIDISTGFFNNGWNEMSINLWFNSSSNIATSGPGQTFLNTSPHNGIGIGYSYSGNQKIYVFKNSNPASSSWDTYAPAQFNASSIPLNTWHNISIVKSGLTYQFYFDGQLDNTLNTSTVALNYFCNLRFGAITCCNPEVFNGKLDDISIFSRSLSLSEIQQIYNLEQITYLWSNGATTSTINVSPTTTTTYTYTVTTNGVSCTDEVTVVVNNPVIDLGADVTVCGTSTTLTAPSGYDSYLWSNGGTTNTTVVTANGTYSCTVTQGGCSATDSIYVTLIDATITASDSIICAGENILLNVPSYSVGDSIISPAIYLANITQGSVFEYSSTVPPAGWQTSFGGWSQGALPFIGVNTGSVPNSTYWPLGSTYYLRKQIDLSNYNLSSINWSIGVDNGYSLYLNGVLISSDNQGGPATEWEYIGTFPQILLNLGTNYIALIISDDGAGAASFNMKVTGNKSATHAWSPGGATTPSINVSPTTTKTYTCTTTINGVSCTDSVTVVVNNPTIDLGSDVTACGTSTTLTAPSGFDSFFWSNGGTTNTTTVSANGTYSCTVTQGGCSANDSIDVTFIDATISASDSVICAGETVTLSVTQGGSASIACAALPTNLQTGLVGYWPFCGNANDESGNGNNGTVNGATLTTDRFGSANSAYSFDGVNDGVQVAIPSIPVGSTSRSLSTWIYTSLSGNNFNYSHPSLSTVAAYGNSAGGPVIFPQLISNLTGNLYLETGSSQNQIYSTQPVNNAQWHNLITTYNGSVVKMYVDGILNATSNSVSLATAFSYLGIGVCPWAPIHFEGKIDDVMLFNRALSDIEILNYFQNSNSYAWSTGASTPTINVSPTSTTTYTCTTTTNGVSCTDSVTVVVNNPTINLGNDVTVCGTSTTLTAPSGFDSYLWSNGGTTNTTTVTSNGTYSCTVTQGGCSASDTIDVTLIDATITASDSVICAGETVTLSVTQGGSSNTACAALPTNLQTGLVGYWPFCGNANDESGNGNNGTVNGATLTTDRFGNSNSAYHFTGVNCCGTPDPISEIAVESPFLALGGDYTISCWMSSDDIQKYQQCLFNSINHTGFAVELNNEHVPSRLSFGVGPANAFWDLLYAPGGNSSYVNSQWYNVGFVKSGTTYKMYLNGQLDYSTVISNSSNYNQTVGLRIGSIGGGHENFKGMLDDYAVWNRALSVGELQELLNITDATASSGILWSTGATTPSINVSPTATTTYTCAVTTNGVTCTDSFTVVVNNPTINLGNDVTACGTSTTLTAPTGFDSYLWSNGGTTNTTTVSANGTYSCTVTQGGCSASDSIDVTLIDATISASDSVICVGESVTLSVPQGGSSNIACAALPSNLQTGLVGYWPFCGNANDASGNGNNGTVNGASLTADRFGSANSAYHFNGSALVSMSVNHTDVTDYSVLGWMKSTSDFGGTFVQVGADDGLLGCNGFAIGKGGNTSLNSDSGNNLVALASCVSWYPTSTLINPTQDWHQFAMVKNVSSFKLYIDGTLVHTINNGTVNFPSPYIFIGGNGPSSQVNTKFYGDLDDITTINRSLSSTEIQQFYSLGLTTYLWSNGATTASINVSPTTTTTYTCTTTINGVSCSSNYTITVNNSSASTNIVTAFDSFTWLDGNTYTASNNTATYTTTNAAGCDSVISLNLTITPSSPTLALQVFLDGYYINGSNPSSMRPARYNNLVASESSTPGAASDVDVITVELRSPYNLDVVAYSVSPILQTNGSVQCVFPAGALGGSYYLVVKHRATNPLWSANPVTLSSSSAFSFANNSSNSYSDGSITPINTLVPSLFGIWLGELNDDGYLDGLDYPWFENETYSSVYGGLYLLDGDFNGDAYVDASDYAVFDYNSTIGSYEQRPY